jgi:light-regulated signal transduction histidine kinase (bacteriophytochrome)
MQSLIQGMLALSRAGGRETAPLRSTSSTEVLASTLETLQAAIEEASAEVVFEELPVVLGDAAQLTQVFQNLISNAIKYRRPGQHPRIRIWAERENEHWRFGVQDNGLGFPQALADRIFAPFRRLHGPEIPGAGIGLALCRRIIDRHRGRMWAESQEGTGATFYFTLPAAESTSAEANR